MIGFIILFGAVILLILLKLLQWYLQLRGRVPLSKILW